MNQVGAGAPGEIPLDILRHREGRRGGGKILLRDLENPVEIFSQPIGAARPEGCQGGDLGGAERVEKICELDAPPMLGLPRGEKLLGAEEEPGTYSLGHLADTEETGGVEHDLLVEPDIGSGKIVRDA